MEIAKPDAALAFYCDLLGFRVLTDQPTETGGRWIELGIAASVTRLALFLPRAERARRASPTVSFFADDVNKTSRRLIAAGVEFVQPPARRKWGTVATFKDPEGRLFAISSRR
jgi:predicted enzyme related to lactoylglutathione lyase